MNIKSIIKEPWPRIIGIPLLALLLTYLVDGLGEGFLNEYLINLLFVFVIWNTDYYIIIRFRKIFPNLNETYKRIIATIFTVFLLNISVTFVVGFMLHILGVEGFNSYSGEEFEVNHFKIHITTIVLGLLYESGYFFESWKKQTIEIEQVKNQQLRSELIFLKNHISPHFLFNSLNTLVSLIDENPGLAIQFTEKLSQVYRYILQYKDKEVIKLETELDFIEAYSYLLNIRFENSLIITTHVDASFKQKYVAPLAIQMLVENAVKHNVVSLSRPLSIDIFVENGKSIVVKNNLQKRTNGVSSLKTGLENIKLRYKYICNRSVDVVETRKHFLVALPLIEIIKEPKYDLI